VPLTRHLGRREPFSTQRILHDGSIQNLSEIPAGLFHGAFVGDETKVDQSTLYARQPTIALAEKIELDLIPNGVDSRQVRLESVKA
jgi:hypothetical protein